MWDKIRQNLISRTIPLCSFSAQSPKNPSCKSWPPLVFTPWITNKVNFFTNRYDDFMTSSMKTSPINPMRPIFGDVLLVSSCKIKQKPEILEKAYIGPYTVKC